MIEQIFALFARLYTGRVILILLALFLMANILLPIGYPTFQTLDTLSSYTPEQAYTLISSYGAQGRLTYMINELTVDLLYPIIVALLFSGMIYYSLMRAFPRQPAVRWFALAPFVLMLLDYLENICVILLLARFPAREDGIASAANILTQLKMTLSWAELIFALVGWFALLIRLVVKGRTKATA